MSISVAILMYGDHADFAKRCLGSIQATIDPSVVSEIRIGLNACCPASRAAAEVFAASVGVRTLLYEPSDRSNRLKYPMMRKMWYDHDRPITADHVMWFDDDSFIAATRRWWKDIDAATINFRLIGAKYTMRLPYPGPVVRAIESQPWYTGKSVRPPYRPEFCTGGWWVAPVSVLKKWNYPFPEIQHNGGDTILGELFRQQGLDLAHMNSGVKINADDLGRESRAERRGKSLTRLWYDYVPGKLYDLTHHDFTVDVREFPPCSIS